MTREDHQPSREMPERPPRSKDEMRAVCGRTIAFALALGPRTDSSIDDIRFTIEQARRAQVAAVYVLASPPLARDAMEAVRLSGSARRGHTLVEALEYDPAAALPLTRDAGDFELINLPFGLLETVRVITEASLDDYEFALIADTAQTRVTADHFFELCSDAREHPAAEVVVSWIEQLRRTPCLLTRPFLDRLEARDPDLLGGLTASGARRVPHIRLRDHVFGEERLAPPKRTSEQAEALLGSCTLSALQAVELATSVSTTTPQTPARPPLGDADELLVRAAAAAVETSSGLRADEAAELAWADAFGRACRRDFPLLNQPEHAGTLAYLDSAATAQRVDVALQAQRDFDERGNANVYRGSYALSSQATTAFDEARAKLAAFIGADPQRIAFTANATGALNLVALAWGERIISVGDVIVCTLSAHHSTMLPFLLLAERKGARVVHVGYDEVGRLDRDAYARALEASPKLVCLAHIGNVFGIEAPVSELAAQAHAAGARVLVDAAQSFPHVKLDVGALGADWLAFSAHKAYGPFGVGALWASDAAFDEMDPVCAGGGVVSHASSESYYLRADARQYEPGTPPISQAIGWAAAVGYMEHLGMDSIARHDAALTRYAVRGLNRIDGVHVVGDHAQLDGQHGLVAFTVRGGSPGDVGSFLGRLGVAIRSGGHCALPLHASLGMIGTGRISIGVYTTRADIDAALAALALYR